MNELDYTPLERLRPPRPVHRVPYLVERCRGRVVLDLGCLDETALGKRETAQWLHGELVKSARRVLGVDSSNRLPEGGLETGANARIVRGDVTRVGASPETAEVEIVVAGELIEHLPDALEFLTRLRRQFPGRELVVSTPNATSLTNVLLAAVGRESCHADHLQVYSFKSLATLARRAGFDVGRTEIVPYHVYYTELELRSSGAKRWLVRFAAWLVRILERAVPMLSGGWILRVERM